MLSGLSVLSHNQDWVFCHVICSGGSKGGARDACPPLGVQILSISYSFWDILAKWYVGAPPGSWHPLLGEILDPPLIWTDCSVTWSGLIVLSYDLDRVFCHVVWTECSAMWSGQSVLSCDLDWLFCHELEWSVLSRDWDRVLCHMIGSECFVTWSVPIFLSRDQSVTENPPNFSQSNH